MKREWLIQLRKSKQMTQQLVASRAFIDRTYYSHLESGTRNPSVNVAEKIGQILGFDPLDFFQEQLELDLKKQKDTPYKSMCPFNQSGISKILYLYNHIDVYLERTAFFLLEGIKLDAFWIIIDTEHNITGIQAKLRNHVNPVIIERHLLFLNKDEVKGIDNFKINRYFEDKKFVQIWINEEDNTQAAWWTSLTSNHFTKPLLLVISYQASRIPASLQIKTMREFPFLMTDLEFVSSPLYDGNKETVIYPSLYIQDPVNFKFVE